MKLKVYFDGACHNKKNDVSKMGVGVHANLNDEEIYAKGFSPNILGTSNIAEWTGCLAALIVAQNQIERIEGIKEVELISDSQLIVNQLKGTWSIRETNFLNYYYECQEIITRLKIKVSINWVPREQNKRADELSKIGIKS